MVKPKATIISEFNSNNLGDQAISKSLTEVLDAYWEISQVPFGNLRGSRKDRPKASDTTSSSFFGGLSKAFPAKIKARIRWYFMGERRLFGEKFTSSIKDCDLVIIGGGQLIKNNVALFCEKIALIGGISKKHSIPLAFVGVGVDSAMSKLTWRIVDKTLIKSGLTIVRDLSSKTRIERRLVDRSNVTAIPDLAFCLNNPGARFNRKDSIRKSLALNIMDFDLMLGASIYNKDNILDGILKVIHRAVLDGYEVCLFTSGSPKDFIAANQVKAKILSDHENDLPVFHPSSLQELLDFYIDFNEVIAMRMHTGILAYISGCNPICVNWDDKVASAWNMIDQKERVIELKEFAGVNNCDKLFDKFKRVGFPSRNSVKELADEVRNHIVEQVSLKFS